MGEYRDVSDEIFTRLLRVRIDLFKEIIEGNGGEIDLGPTNNTVGYQNYLASDPITINSGFGDATFPTGDYNVPPEMAGKLDAQVSKYYKLRDLVRTSRAKLQDNLPTPQHEKSLYTLANNILDPITEMCGGKLIINSVYRNPAVNKAVGGSPTSQHALGQAADIDAPAGMTNQQLYKMIFNAIASGRLKVGQLIWEGGDNKNPAWIHVSLPYSKTNQLIALEPSRNMNNILAGIGLKKTSNMM